MKKQHKTVNNLAIVSRRSVLQASAKTMFLWVAGASVLVVTISVLLIYIHKQFTFNNTVISYETTAASTLKDNFKAYVELKKNIDDLAANSDLASVRTTQSNDNLQVITDSLATTSDISTFAASIQNIIAPRSGVSLESVTMASNSIAGSGENPVEGMAKSSPIEIPYQIEAVGSYQSITSFLENLERTIRPVHVKSIELNGSDSTLRAQISLVTYYQPVKDVNISKKEISLE
ncbi:hypothetical protein EOL73_02045 [Candidatus Saccharibacteria bacterium]|nr:hypothetical protein [Candidatus Saccharibacteria bacterium]NCU40518.1 hypothetical protein [Candidatus Saccharibacteria bacterium]